ncbi:MAG TPA: LuxR C-terminal-related transcriptional regulator [Solirubrobacteraceae bacterium]|jgi:LuxR family maltose regulon positive regulatory protein|nr:LuxR C-terminal-related transcriptional regulator [Solirubrobacteraceae bacterium]
MSLAVKSGRPLSREGFVQRPRLLAKLADGQDAALVTIVAPAGYGKTSLLAEWAEWDSRPTVFLSVESRHEDPLLLVGDLLAGLEEIEPLDARPGAAFAELQSDATVGVVLPMFLAVLEARADPLVLILDNADSLTGKGTSQLLSALAEQLPPGSQLVLASRTRPALPLGRLRARGSLLELGAGELAMTHAEAASLFRAAGMGVGRDALDVLLRRTEGWPAGLCLAVLCAREDSDGETALTHFAGDDHIVADYLRDEFLAALGPEELEFLVEASILDRLSGPICDTVLQTGGSARLLDRLAHSGLPLWPIDRSHERYRPHQLLRDMLLGELRHSHPEREIQLHLRACAWYSEHGELDSAVAHAVAAGAPRLAGDLLWEHLPRCLAAGRNELVQEWLGRFSPAELSAHATLALTAAHSALARGDLREAEHWGLVGAAALARSTAPATVASLPAGVAVIEAAVGRHGMIPMARDAARAYALEAEDSPWRAIFSLLQGVAEHLTGDPGQAREHLRDGIHRSCLAAPPVETLCLSQLAMIAVEEGDWDQGADLIARAIHQIERHNLSSYPTSALSFALSADVRSQIGHVDEGKRHARRAAHLLARLSDFIPWYEAETRIALARAALRLADIRAARALLAEASQLARRVPDAVIFGGWLDDTWGLVDSAATSALAGPAALTIAELRILRFLPTHLSFREIGERLHVSTNTVKTQAHAVYRKLDVSSRSGAVERATEIGLLDG